jgi:two-component system LytT family sensor kinase
VNRKTIIFIHIGFWLLFFISNTWPAYQYNIFSHAKNDPSGLPLFIKTLIIETGYLTIPITCFYIASNFVGPFLFVKRQYTAAALITILTVVVATTLRYLLEYYFFLPILGFDNYNGHAWSLYDFTSNVFFYYFPRYFVYGLLYFFARNWYISKRMQQELEKEKATAELRLLKSQLNPHFLFNSINDIYSLSYRESKQTPIALLKLSDILRYMLHEGVYETVPLKQEVEYLESLVELQRISAKGDIYIEFEVEGYVGEQQIAPMLFISFVENAFKHGVLNAPTDPAKIRLIANSDNLEFTVRNKKNHYEKDKTGGIGLNNVRRRLELIYPGKHQLDIANEQEIFDINLKLKTST